MVSIFPNEKLFIIWNIRPLDVFLDVFLKMGNAPSISLTHAHIGGTSVIDTIKY